MVDPVTFKGYCLFYFIFIYFSATKEIIVYSDLNTIGLCCVSEIFLVFVSEKKKEKKKYHWGNIWGSYCVCCVFLLPKKACFLCGLCLRFGLADTGLSLSLSWLQWYFSLSSLSRSLSLSSWSTEKEAHNSQFTAGRGAQRLATFTTGTHFIQMK